jgi:carboxylesterase
VKTQIIPTTEPFFFPGGRTGVLLVHGFTGTPKEMRWMGEYLNKHGLTCLGIRLNGHATNPEDMRRSRWTDWTASVEDGFHLLSGSVDRIYLAGLSMGGVLTLLMSTCLGERVAGVVAMSTPYSLPRDPRNYSVEFLKLYGKFVKFAPKSGQEPGASWIDKDAFADHISYARNPVISVAELKALLYEMQAALPEVRKPVLLIHSREDSTVSPENIEKIYDELVNASDKTKLYVTGSGHVITKDAVRQQVFESTLNFIQRVETQFES